MTPDMSKPDESGLEPTAKIPKPFWKRAEIDVRKLFEGLTKGFRDWSVKDYQSLPQDLVKVLSSVSLKDASAPELAWTLVYSALAHSMVKNTEPILVELSFSKDEDPKAFADALKLPDFEGAVQFSPSFMENPADAPFFGVVRTAYQNWLLGAGLPPADAALVAGRLGTAFTFALHREWLENSGNYAPLLDWLDSPFARAVDRERRWLAYYAWLETQLDESVFGQSYGLRDLYIPLNAYYEIEYDDIDPDTGYESKVTLRKTIPLEEHLREWLEEIKPKYSLLLVSGGPGSGKSSFLKHFAATLGRVRKPVIFIPLQHFAYRQDLANALKQFIHSHHTLKGAADVENGDELILLFDGLDELSMAGTHGEEAARSFVAALKEYLYRTNHPQCRVRAILSGRELAIQSDRNLQRDDGRILHLLPYFTPEAEREPRNTDRQWGFDDPMGILERDYRGEWWEKFHRLLSTGNKGAPKTLLEPPFDVLTNQPLLNVLIAISVTGKQSGTLQIDANTNLNEVYAHLLHRVWERNDEKAVNRGTPRIEEEKFNAALEAVAVVTWHGNGRTADARAIADKCGQQLLSAFSDQAEKSVYSLLVGFFFHDRGQDDSGHIVYEFTHRSFGEYLTARSLVRMLKDLIADHLLWKESSGRGKDLVTCIKGWAEHCGPTDIDGDLLHFIQREIALECKSEIEGRNIRAFVVSMMNLALEEGLPIEQTHFRSKAFLTQVCYARNAELALLLVLAAIPWTEHELERTIELRWPNETAAGNWLNRLRGQRYTLYDFSSAMYALTGIGFPYQLLTTQDLISANLIGTQSKFVDFSYSNLEGAELTDSDLSNASLVYSNLRGADLTRANLSQADLAGAQLEGAVLNAANLQGAELPSAALPSAELDYANLESTNLEHADLESASLFEAVLKYAQIQDANLRSANLTGANLCNATLRGVDLFGTVLQRANLENIQDWRDIACINRCDISNVQNAPEGFIDWALERGAFQY